ncbi:PIN domain-containing protein [Acidithiobacillus ferrianus]|uniref:PIN domain-containing protein n=1 Tax=Acidithiobacillus ferrianus TaxID=2678518 RepID=UPI003F732D92
MRAILDTNVLLGALISPHGSPDAIYRAWRAARFDLVTSTAQIDELRRVSRYPRLKIILPAHRVGAMVNNMQRAMVSREQSRGFSLRLNQLDRLPVK